MNITFFIKSVTINIEKFNIKDIAGSSGRLDVISRCILAAILGFDYFEKNIQIWIFLNRYGTFVFDTKLLNYENFPKNEIKFTDFFVRFLRNKFSSIEPQFNPLNLVNSPKLNFLEAIKHFQELNYDLYILSEQGLDFKVKLRDIKNAENILFIIGSQKDEFLNSEELLSLKIPTICIGNQLYLASSVIRLLKLHKIAF
ncbi:MAG: hypothetical protein ACFFDH_17090 [Promethearchaeota archaeon]